MKKITGILLLFLVALLAVSFMGKNYLSQQVKKTIAKPFVSPTPTLIPFYDMTVPYLRSRIYNSKLGEQTFYAHGYNYTSYLTSYTSDNLKINGLLTKPDGPMPKDRWPAIVFVHGYIPPKQYVTTERYIAYVDYLARNGFVVFKIDLRGHGNSEGEASGGYYSSGYVIDTLNAYAALQASDFVNKKEIGLWGHSMAGNTVMRAFAVKPEIPAVVIWAGAVYTYTDFVQYGITDESFQPSQVGSQSAKKQQKILATYGKPTDQSSFWKMVAPASYLNDLKGAIQIDQSIDDSVVSINYSKNLDTLLNATKVPHEFFTYPSGGHNISDPSFTSAMQNTVAFFNKYLKPVAK